MKKLFFILCFLIMCLNNLQAQWTWQNPRPQGNNLTGVKVFEDGSVIAIGQLGTFIKTTDNGKTWATKNLGYSNNLNSMFFINDSVGWIVGSSSLILKTTNKGETWEKQDWHDTLNAELLSVYFINADTGWVGSNYFGNYYGLLLNTTDGGRTWNYQKFQGSLEQIYFVNDSLGWISSANFQMYNLTKDGGKSWVRYLHSNIESVYFIDTSNGFYSSSGVIYKTSDGGTNWLPVINTGYNNSISKILFLDKNNGWVVGYQNFGRQKLIVNTTDGGNTWSINSSFTQGTLTSIDFNKEHVGFSVGSNGGIVCTSDGGKNWEEVSSENIGEFKSIFFTDLKNGWAVGKQYDNLVGIIFNTTDGGDHWKVQFRDSSYYLNSVFFVNPLIGWAAGMGRIIKTLDGGKSWSQQYSDNVTSIYFLDEYNGWVINTSGNILNTTDGGNSWYLINPTTQKINYYNTIFFRDKNMGFIAGGDQTSIMKTTNGGIDWNTKATGSNILSISFADSIRGIAVGSNGTILKTTDRGESWSNLPRLINYNFNSVYMFDSLKGLIAGNDLHNNSAVLYTSDGGINWVQQSLPTNGMINSMYFKNPNNGWVTGHGGIILKYHTDDTVTSIYEKGSINLPGNFYLSQNYPNPFNPTTRIKYSISSPVWVVLKIYDVLGREIKSLINEYQPAGNYSLLIDLAQNPSGVYYYKIQAGNFIKTRKMILIK